MALSIAARLAAAPASLRVGLPYWERLALVQSYVIIAGLLVYTVRRLPPGAPRLLVALPVVALNFLAPLLFDGKDDLITNLSVFINATSLTTFKVLAWALDRGALVRPLTLAQFVAVFALPITPAEAPAPGSAPGASSEEDVQGKQGRGGGRLREIRSAPELAKRILGKSLALALTVGVLASASLPRLPTVVLQGFSQYCSLSMSMDAAGALVSWALDLPVAPHFDNPYRSTSASEFWNKRWNLTVSNVMRALIYDPIMEGRWVARRGQFAPFSRVRRLAGVLAVFFASGVMHEAMFVYATGHLTPGLRWLTYFVLWGVICVAESVARKAGKRRGVTLPAWVKWAYTMTLFHVLVERLWWVPAEQARLPQIANEHALAAWRGAVAAVQGAAKVWELQAGEL